VADPARYGADRIAVRPRVPEQAGRRAAGRVVPTLGEQGGAGRRQVRHQQTHDQVLRPEDLPGIVPGDNEGEGRLFGKRPPQTPQTQRLRIGRPERREHRQDHRHPEQYRGRESLRQDQEAGEDRGLPEMAPGQ